MKRITLSLIMLGALSLAQAQQFEAPQIDSIEFTKVKPFVGGDFAIQFQDLSHHANVPLVALGTGFNLPTANFTLGADLAPGVQVVLETYLSARHHNETWVKGGYLLVDKMPFFQSSFVDNVMENVTIKAGVMELNYGDAHYRRSDNGKITNNMFVGNNIMNAFTTAPALEIYYRNDNGIIAMGGIGQVIVNQVISSYDKNEKAYKNWNTVDELSFYGKVGIDKQLNSDLRVRATLSAFNGQSHSMSLYNGDRTGSRYYLVMNPQDATGGGTDIKSPHLTGDYNNSAFGTPTQNTSFMLSLFTKYRRFELFGFYDMADGSCNTKWNATNLNYDVVDYKMKELNIEGLYRLGGKEQFYLGARYNTVDDQLDQKIVRYQAVAGWKLTENIITKFEYVNQEYKDFASYGKESAGFKGFMVEAGISF